MIEQALLLGAGRSLVGVVTQPATPNGTAAIITNAGTIHRVGPSRLGVRLARQLAERGFLALRFDHSGIGDSWLTPGEMQSSGDAMTIQTREVMDDMEAYGVRRFVLIGLCSGAVTALKTAFADDRVVGVVMVNAMGHSSDVRWNLAIRNQRWARSYWKHSALRIESWKRALTGRIRYRRLLSVLRRQVAGWFYEPKDVTAVTNEVRAQVGAILARGVRLVSLHSAGDTSLRYFDAILGAELDRLQASGRFEWKIIDETDHAFSVQEKQQELLDEIETWASTAWTNPVPTAAGPALEPASGSVRASLPDSECRAATRAGDSPTIP